ncbi:glucose/quinate/shikimate family membrane-bound PQQ-dependent dehydrogenase [Rhodobacter sp. CZR27]|uniref:glucose/quinate/shikimate family membrane-bound PQQ-dependent dehydrogenase n=1 Tax=Rhodobacter sp. CZR27 TaxID=2033869 RepID=UPI000BBE9246|nr:glucose/quinate/shikimate family membrane-bound PQQ-dependent dehydrogenase [Rhodobacter sp. CZR27]
MTAITALVFALVGFGLLIPGAWLLLLGGSWFHLLAGAAILLTAVLILRRSAAAVWLYGLVILGALVWAVREVGFDWWQLIPRGGVFVLLGLWLYLPLMRRRLVTSSGGVAPGLPLALPLLAAVGTALWSWTADEAGHRGRLPTEVVNPQPDLGPTSGPEDWHQYGRTQYGQRYSPLDQITMRNVGELVEVWQYRTGDVKLPQDVTETTYQVTPLKVGDRLFICTPHNLAIALDAATGAEHWRFDANSGLNPDRQHQTCRGVTYWRDPAREVGASCAERVYLPTADARLIALDAATGEVCTFFAENGTLHLEHGMPYTPAGFYYSTSPPVAVGGRVIIGGAVNDNFSIRSQSGVIRAFDANSGALLWNWDSGNPDTTAPIDWMNGETYTANSPNSWSVFSVDEERGLVFIPLGNQVPDQLGMGRSAAVEAHSSSVVALDVVTGAKRWVFQTVHHDLWDMDVPAQPVLLDLTIGGESVPALVQPTKQGDIYVLNRETGEPLLPVTEEPAPQEGGLPEETLAATQPTSALSFKPAALRERDMWGLTIFDQLVCRIQFHRLSYDGRYTPPSVGGSIVHPGNFGTFNWGSVAVDPERQVMFGMPTYLPFEVRLVPRSEIPPPGADTRASEQGLNRNEGAPYGVMMGPFLGPLQVPCSAPPWGYVAGADLRTGKIAWMHRNGTVRDMTPLPLPFKVGVPGIGGPIVTKGGVAFLAATVDNELRAYDLTTGEQLWQQRLPAGGQSTPMTYMLDGRQFVVMVAGGHGSVGTDPGDYVIAYALPE